MLEIERLGLERRVRENLARARELRELMATPPDFSKPEHDQIARLLMGEEQSLISDIKADLALLRTVTET